MGSSQSNMSTQLVSILSQSVTNILIKQAQSTTATTTSTNTFSLIVGQGASINCNINLSQSIKQDSYTSAISSYQNTTDLISLMNNAISQATQSNQKAMSEFLSTTFGSQSSNSDNVARLQNILQQNVSQTNLQNVLSQATSLNSGTFIVEGTINNCNNTSITQDIVMTQFVQQVTGMITSAMIQDTQIANALQDLSNQQSAENKGIGSAISQILQSFGLFVFLPLIIIAVLVLILNAKGIISGKQKPKY